MPSIITPRVPGIPAKGLTPKTWAPVSYTSEVTGLGAGETLPLPQASLQSGFNTPYFIDEIRFTAYTGTYTGIDLAGDISGMIGFQLSASSYAFSRGGFGQTSFVPMILYAPTYSSAASTTNGPLYESMRQAVSATENRRYVTRRWVLPKPLFMPAGDTILAAVNRVAAIGTDIPDITAQVTVIGRALPPNTPTPAKRQIPFVGYYVHPSTATYSEGNFQLLNPFKSDWNVQRMVIATRTTAANGFSTGAGFLESPDGTTRYASIKLTDSLGYKITGSSAGGFVPIADVASRNNDSVWTFSRPLPPNEQYNAAFQITTGTITNTVFDVLFSMVGYRDE
jgi:hypothetical protein